MKKVTKKVTKKIILTAAVAAALVFALAVGTVGVPASSSTGKFVFGHYGSLEPVW
jgi:hypothetical protein